MKRTMALIGRELRGYFLTPSGYIIIALFALMTGLVFSFAGFADGQPAAMRSVFGAGTWMLLFVCPAITMRAIAEERRMGTIELLLSSPVSVGQVIAAKYLASVMFLACLLLPTLLQVAALEWYGRPDYGEVAAGYLGMLLAGSAYLASGVLFSALTASQVVAFLAPLFLWVIAAIAAKALPVLVNDTWAGVAFAVDPDLRLRDFSIGLIDTSNVVYFLSIALVCLVVATRATEAWRWR